MLVVLHCTLWVELWLVDTMTESTEALQSHISCGIKATIMPELCSLMCVLPTRQREANRILSGTDNNITRSIIIHVD